jgi:hypothetical protein
MISPTIFTLDVRGVLCSLAVAALLTAGMITRAQHQGHNMQVMPGMQMPTGAPSTTPQSSPAPEQKMDMTWQPSSGPMHMYYRVAGESRATGS